MYSVRRLAAAFAIAMPLLLGGAAYGLVVDEDEPDVTGRVARISYISGDVQVRHAGAQDWEKAVLNLPLVEGDELTTSRAARFEIQFDSRTFVRVAESSYLRIVSLKDEGIALSLPQGSASIRVTDFDKDRTFLEIDVPKTTIAVQRSGFYRIDAGPRDALEARVRITDGGEARIYSDTSGFTLKNGRLATIFLGGSNAGEWETADASRFSDEFDTWSLDRDATLAKRLNDAYYDKYYDRDIYGAEDLNDYGQWVYTRKYGYVWRPFATSVSHYSDWSPYRYGHWRWIPPYGWTWVNDEPWGWATYHYGRWIWDDGSWYWTPYGYYRYRRSWWSPALVVVAVYNSNICWYPLPYNSRYYNYNSYGGNYGGRGNHRNPSNGGPRPTASPTPTGGGTQARINEERRLRLHTPPLASVPPGGVVTVPTEEFGRGRSGIRRAPLDVAKNVLSKEPETNQNPPILPKIDEVSSRITKEIRAEMPPSFQIDDKVRTGAAERKAGGPLDEDLRKSRIFGNRTPLPITNSEQAETKTVVRESQEPRSTGAVSRPVKLRDETPVTQTPPSVQPRVQERKYDPPPKQEEPKYEPRPRMEPPRYEPPPKSETPRYEPPPKREDPPPRKSDPPPAKSEPRPEKPSPPSDKSGGNKKDG